MPSGVPPISGGVGSVGIVTGVCVTVGVNVAVGELVAVGVAEAGGKVGVEVTSVAGGCVFVGFGFRVRPAVGVQGMKTRVFVGLVAITAVLVAEEMVVGAEGGVDVALPTGVSGVPVMIDTPGVRKSTQPGGVRMATSTGSTNPLGRRVR